MSVAQHDTTTNTTRTGATARSVGLAAGIALVGNLLLLGIAAIADVDLTVRSGGTVMEIGVLAVAASTLLALVIGGLVTVLAARRSPRAPGLLAWVGLAVAVVSLAAPLNADATVGTRVALSAMHLLAGFAWWASLRRGDRR